MTNSLSTNSLEAQGRDFSVQATGEPGQAVTLTLAGRIALATFPALKEEITGLLDRYSPASLTVDVAGVAFLDSVGALCLVELEEDARSRAIPFRLVNASEELQKILGIIDRKSLATLPLKVEEKPGLVEKVGGATLTVIGDLVQVTTFVWDLILSLTRTAGTP